jgi:hypothetical protein
MFRPPDDFINTSGANMFDARILRNPRLDGLKNWQRAAQSISPPSHGINNSAIVIS